MARTSDPLVIVNSTESLTASTLLHRLVQLSVNDRVTQYKPGPERLTWLWNSNVPRLPVMGSKVKTRWLLTMNLKFTMSNLCSVSSINQPVEDFSQKLFHILLIANFIFQFVPFSLSSRAAVLHLNLRAGSTFPFPVCTVSSSMDRTCRCNKVDAVRLYASLKGVTG